MIIALFKWLTCVLLACAAMAWALRLAGVGLRWVGDRLPLLILATAGIAYCIAWGGEKPGPGPGPGPGPEPPTPSGVTNWIHRIPVGRRADGTIMPYGAPIRNQK